MTTTARALAAPDRLTAIYQVRFTEAQDALLRELTRYNRRPLSATIRDIVVCWAVNHVNEDAELTGESAVIDLRALGAELNRLADLEIEASP